MDKTATLEKLESGFKEVLAAVEGLDERAMSTVFYGEWTPKELLGHIAGWHREMTAAMERMARGEKPTPEGVDYSDSDGWNAGFAATMRPQNATTAIATLRQSFMNYLRAAKAIPDDRYGEGKTVNRLLETSGFGHYAEHLPALQELKSKAGAG